MDSGLAAPHSPSYASGPKLCRECGEPLAKVGPGPRRGTLYCSARCRRNAWGARTFGRTATASETDFETLREMVERMLREHRLEQPERPIAGYVLRNLSPIGPVDFPEPGRRTKRAPDKTGSCRMSSEGFYGIEPFEFPRVPVKGRYEVLLAEQNGTLIRTLGHVTIFVAFPSVRLYDATFHYDFKGRKLWANEAPRVRRVRQRPRRQDQAAAPSSAVRDAADTAPAAAPTAVAIAPAVNQSEARPTSTNRQAEELASKLEGLLQTLASERAARLELEARLDRLQREREQERLHMRAQAEELEAARVRNKLLLYLHAQKTSAPSDRPRPAWKDSAESVTDLAAVVTGEQDAPLVAVSRPQADGHGAEAVAPSAAEVARQHVSVSPIAPEASLDHSDGPTPAAPVQAAQQDEPSQLTATEPPPPQIAQTQVPPAPKTDPPKSDGKSTERTTPRVKPALPKKPPEGPLFGLAANSWRTSHRIR